MSVPDYQTCMLPVLTALRDGNEILMRDLTQQLAEGMGLSDEDRREMLPSGQQTVFANRVAWAKTYLKKAGLVVNPSRGRVQITEAGKIALAAKPEGLDVSYLKQFPTFVSFFERTSSDEPTADPPSTSRITPEELFETTFEELNEALADEVLDRVQQCSPEFFERMVLQVLIAMGYGGSLKDAAERVGRSGDGGIDGIIKEDKLGLDALYIQAKRWDRAVGRPEVQQFAGSMEGFRAKKGVFLTTATFSKEAVQYVERIERKIVLVDGRRLAHFMIDHNVGVETSKSFVLKRLDSDYFDDGPN